MQFNLLKRNQEGQYLSYTYTYLLHGVQCDCHFKIRFNEYNLPMKYSVNNYGGYRNQIDSVCVSFTYCPVWQMN